MSDKKIVFQSVLDTADFDNKIKKMQQDLAKINATPSQLQAQQNTAQRLDKMGMGGQMSAPSQEAFKRATQSARREIDLKIKEEIAGQEKLSKVIAARQAMLEKLQKNQENTVKNSQEELKIKQQIARVEENNFRLRESYKQKDADLNKLLDAKQSQMNQPPPGGGGGNIEPKEGGSPSFKNMLMAVGGIGALVKAIQTGLTLYRAQGELPIRTDVASGSAISGTIGRELATRTSGLTGIDSAWNSEKMLAMKHAQENLENQKSYDKWAAALKIGAGMVTGALIGGPVGFVAGGLTGIGAAVSDERQRSLLGGITNKEYKKNYEALNAEDLAKYYNTDLNAQKEMNPAKDKALENYGQNWQSYLAFQRATGTNYDSFHGYRGLRAQASNAGFMDSDLINMGNSILSAGGSGNAAGRSAIMGLQANRGFGINSASVLGNLSSSLGNSASTNNAFYKILEESMRKGIDSSELVSENKKFTEIASDIIANTGVKTERGTDAVLDQLTGFFGDNTMRGMSAGQSAYEAYNDAASSTTGQRGAMRAAGFLKDDVIGKFSATDRAALNSVIENNQLTPDNLTLQDIAERNNVSVDDLITKSSGINKGSVAKLQRTEDLRKSLTQKLSKSGLDASELYNGNLTISPDLRKEAGEFRTLTQVENADDQRFKDPRFASSFSAGQLGSKTAEARAAMEDMAYDKLHNPNPNGRTEETTQQQNVEGFKVALKSFQDLGTTIGLSVESVKQLNANLSVFIETAKKLPKDQQAGFFNTFFPHLQTENQVQGGKPSK